MMILFFFFLLVALVLFWISGQQLRAAGIPGGKILSSDTSRWLPAEKTLYAPGIGLTGKPDYLIQQGKTFIPVEVKTGSNPARGPYDSHIMQLAAYCLLIQEVYGVRPSHGVLHYTGSKGEPATFTIPYSSELEKEVRGIIAQIQTQPLRGGVDRSHNSPARCSRCGFREHCDQALRGG